MDNLDLAFLAVFRNRRRAAAAVRRYGAARFRQHLAAKPLTFVPIEEEPRYVRGSMVNVISAWEFCRPRLFSRRPLTYREEIELFGHPGRMPLRQPLVVVRPRGQWRVNCRAIPATGC